MAVSFHGFFVSDTDNFSFIIIFAVASFAEIVIIWFMIYEEYHLLSDDVLSQLMIF